jgi:hypothetical protein
MGTRLELQTLLGGLQEDLTAYFQPPPNVTLSYPAIIYNRDYRAVDYADNIAYNWATRYQVTVIDADPDSLVPDMVAALPLTKYVRHYTTEGLNHDIYDLYF